MLTSRPDPLRSAISALFDHRWEYPLVPAIGGSDQAARFACVRLRDDVVPALADAHQTSEAMHVQGDHGQSNHSGKSLSTFRLNTVEATVFKIVDGRLHAKEERKENMDH